MFSFFYTSFIFFMEDTWFASAVSSVRQQLIARITLEIPEARGVFQDNSRAL